MILDLLCLEVLKHMEGTLDSGVVKAGFVSNLGELSNPNQISFNEKKINEKNYQILRKIIKI